MDLAHEIFEHSKKLPEDAAREVLDFINFLEQRHTRSPESASFKLEQKIEFLNRLNETRIHWGAKPMENRAEFYDTARTSI